MRTGTGRLAAFHRTFEPRCRARVPLNVLHWAWNLGDSDCVLVESHCPATCARPDVREKSVPLFREGEKPTFAGICETILVPDTAEYAREVEASILGKEL